MKKHDVKKVLNSLGFDNERIDAGFHSQQLQPELPEGLERDKTGFKLRLEPDLAHELAMHQKDIEERHQEAVEAAKYVTPTEVMAQIEAQILEDKPRNFSLEQVVRGVTIYVMEGTAAEVERQTDGEISAHNIGYWKNKHKWFNELVNFIKYRVDHKMEARMTEIVDATTDAILDRIKHGNTGHNKGTVVYVEDPETGERVPSRVPLSARDLSTIGAIWFDKRQIARGMDVQAKHKDVTTIEDKLRSILHKMDEVAETQLDSSKWARTAIDVTPTKEEV